MKLSEQTCKPCEGDEPPMGGAAAEKHLQELRGWKLADSKITKTFEFEDFMGSIGFVNTVAAIAEEEGHHPDIAIHYSKVEITLWTHAIGGLSLNDFILAAKIDEIR